MLQSEGQAMTKHLDLVPNSLAMFVSNSKPNSSLQSQSQGHGSRRGRGRNNFNKGIGGRYNNNGGQHFIPQAAQNFSPQNFSPQNYQNQNSSQTFKADRPSCQICGKSGHQALDCYHRMDFAYQGKNPPTKLATMASASNATIINNQDPWLADSGTTNHLTANLNNLSLQSQYKGPKRVIVGSGQSLPINHIGNATLHTKYHNFMLKNVLHVPRISMNLLFVHRFCLDNNCSCHFDANELKIQDIPTGRLLYKGLSENGVYPIYSKHFIKSPSLNFALSSQPQPLQSQSSQLAQCSQTPYAFHVNSVNKWLLWHHKLGHPSNKVLSYALSSIDVSCTLNNSDTVTHCKHCLNEKMHQLPFNTSDFQASKPLKLIHFDV